MAGRVDRVQCSKETQMANSAQSFNENIDRNLDDTKLRDGANDLNLKGRQFLEDAQDRASEFYNLSNNWVQENRLITMVGVAALTGLLGFFIGRRSGSESNDKMEQIEI
jgi:hypothetical protein